MMGKIWVTVVSETVIDRTCIIIYWIRTKQHNIKAVKNNIHTLVCDSISRLDLLVYHYNCGTMSKTWLILIDKRNWYNVITVNLLHYDKTTPRCCRHTKCLMCVCITACDCFVHQLSVNRTSTTGFSGWWSWCQGILEIRNDCPRYQRLHNNATIFD